MRFVSHAIRSLTVYFGVRIQTVAMDDYPLAQSIRLRDEKWRESDASGGSSDGAGQEVHRVMTGVSS